MCRINVQLLATVRFAFTIYLYLSVVAATSYFLPTRGGVFFCRQIAQLGCLAVGFVRAEFIRKINVHHQGIEEMHLVIFQH